MSCHVTNEMLPSTWRETEYHRDVFAILLVTQDGVSSNTNKKLRY
jgi:hypothetical protein